MRNPQFKEIKPNYRKRVLEITLIEGRKRKNYQLPFSVFYDHSINCGNPFVSIKIDKEVNNQAAFFVLKDGTHGDFPSDLVLYYCDPTYEWSPLNQLKKTLKEKIKASKLSMRVLADALHTSPSQVMRLLQENKSSKQFAQIFQLAELAGYQIEIQLKAKKAA